MEHIHLLVSTFDTSSVVVAHNLKTTLRDQDQDLKKVVLIGLETKTRSREPHPCFFPILQHKNFQHANSDNIRHEIAMQRTLPAHQTK